MEYAPLPTDTQLAHLADALCPGGSIVHTRRLKGGLGCTMDLVRVIERSGSSREAILRRHGVWPEDTGRDTLAGEMAALALARRSGVPVPELLWADDQGVFSERAMVISYIDGAPLLRPDDPLDWATQLAMALVRIHSAEVDDESRRLLIDTHQEETVKLKPVEPPSRFLGHPRGRALWEKRRDLFARTDFPPATFVHGDLWPGNTVWRNARLVAVIDWEDAACADPASDVAYSDTDILYQGLDEAAGRFLDVYRVETGRSLDTLPYWEVAAACRPLPDIARWAPGWVEMGFPTDIDAFRRRHSELVERALSD